MDSADDVYKNYFNHIFGQGNSRLQLLYKDYGLMKLSNLIDGQIKNFLEQKGYKVNIPTSIVGKT